MRDESIPLLSIMSFSLEFISSVVCNNCVVNIYDNQDWIVMPSLTELYQTIYLWNELAVVDQSSTTPGLDSEVQFDIEIPTIDLIQYIELIIQQFPGSQVPLLAIGLAIDYNLYIDIDLEVNMETSGEPRLFRNPENIKFVQDALFGATNEPMGTSYRSRLTKEEFVFAGKTGTSQVRRFTEAQRELEVKNEDLPYEQRDHALFVAFAPYKEPRYSISVLVEHGGSGSKSAAPIAKQVIKKVLEKHSLRESLRNSEETI